MKYIMMTMAAAFVALARVSAQYEDADAAKKAFATIVDRYPGIAATEKIADEVLKQHRKNPDVLVAFANAYCKANDSLRTYRFVDRVLEVAPGNVEARIIAGDFQNVNRRNAAEAMKWYEAAIAADPRNPAGYVKASLIDLQGDPAKALAKLNSIKAWRPDFQSGIAIAPYIVSIIDGSDSFEEQKMFARYLLDCYAECNPDSMRVKDYINATFYPYQLFQDFELSYRYAVEGVRHFPRRPELVRLGLFNSINLKKYDEAKNFADMLFNATDSLVVTGDDYLNAASANLFTKHYDEALALLDEVLRRDTLLNDAGRLRVSRYYAQIWQQKEDYVSAEREWLRYIDLSKRYNRYNSDCYRLLLGMYSSQYSFATTDGEQLAALDKLVATCGTVAEEFPDEALEFMNLQMLYLNQVLDIYEGAERSATDKAAKDLAEEKEMKAARDVCNAAERLVAMVVANGIYDDTATAYLISAYGNMARNNLLYFKNKRLARQYCQKVLAIDPDNAKAMQIMKYLK